MPSKELGLGEIIQQRTHGAPKLRGRCCLEEFRGASSNLIKAARQVQLILRYG